MVRLEKILYEQILNTKFLKRERVLASPSKWYNESRHEFTKIQSHNFLVKGWGSKIYRFLEPFTARLTYQWIRDITQQRGLAMEDYVIHQERELRRCYLFETILRQSTHPYHWIFFKRRRARYYKVEHGVRGFYVPEYIRKEGEERLLAESLENKDQWEDFVYKNYMSDMTPSTRNTVVTRYIPLELFNVYGFFKHEGWNRYFFNETNYDSIVTEENKKKALNPYPHLDLTKETDRKFFEEEINRFIKLYPGAIIREGDKFDFKNFYAKIDLLNGASVEKYDKNVIEKLKTELIQKNAERKEEKLKHKKILGTSFPALFAAKLRKAVLLR